MTLSSPGAPRPDDPDTAPAVRGAVFVSYARQDDALVRQAHAELIALGWDVWIDWEDIPPSADWAREIEGAILATDATVCFVSPDWVRSQVCRTELDLAARHGKRLITVVARRVSPSDLPAELNRPNWIFMEAMDAVRDSVQHLDAALLMDFQHVRAHTRLSVRAAEWRDAEEDSSVTLRGTELSDAERWLADAARRDPQPTSAQRDLIAASRSVELARKAFDALDRDPCAAFTLAQTAVATASTSEAEAALQIAAMRPGRRQADTGHGSIVGVLALGSNRAATASADGTLQFWDVRDPATPICVISTPHGRTTGLTGITPEVLTVYGEGVVTVWEVESGAPRAQIGTGPLTGSIAPLGTASFATCDGRSAHVWDLDGSPLYEVPLQKDPLRLFSPIDAERVVCMGYARARRHDIECRLHVWNLAEQREEARLTVRHGVRAVAATREGSVMASDGNLCSVFHRSRYDSQLGARRGLRWPRRWRPPDVVFQLMGGGTDVIGLVGMSGIAVGARGCLEIWDLRHCNSPRDLIPTGPAQTTALAAAGEGVLVTGDAAGMLRVWETHGVIRDTIHPRAPLDEIWSICQIDQKRFATRESGHVNVWARGDDDRVTAVTELDQNVGGIVAVGDDVVATVGSMGDEISFRRTTQLNDILGSVTVGEDVQLCATGGDAVAAWNTRGAVLVRWPACTAMALDVQEPVCAAANGSGIVILADVRGELTMWSSDDATRPIARLATGRPVSAVVALNEDRAVTLGTDGSLRLWDFGDDGAPIATVTLPKGLVSAACHLKDGFFATAGRPPGRVDVWSLDRQTTPLASFPIGLTTPDSIVALDARTVAVRDSAGTVEVVRVLEVGDRNDAQRTSARWPLSPTDAVD